MDDQISPSAQRTTGKIASLVPTGLALAALLVVLFQFMWLLRLNDNVTRISGIVADISAASGVGVLSPAAALVGCSKDDPGFTLADLRRMRILSHDWLDKVVQRWSLAPDETILIEALHDKWLGQYAETRFLETTGTYGAQDAATAREVLMKRYLMAARSVLGAEAAGLLVAGLGEELPSWEQRPPGDGS